MNVLIVYCHPEKKSFNHAMFQTARDTLRKSGWEICTSDLYAMRFDPVSSRSAYKTVKNAEVFRQQQEEMFASERHTFADFLEVEMRQIEWCDLMIWQFPLWWFGLPALLKGWVDRTFAMGRVYGGGHMYENGFCHDKKALLSLTTGSPADAYRAGGVNGDLLALLRPVWHGMLQFAGFEVLRPNVVYGPARMSETLRRQALDNFAERLKTIGSETDFLPWREKSNSTRTHNGNIPRLFNTPEANSTPSTIWPKA